MPGLGEGWQEQDNWATGGTQTEWELIVIQSDVYKVYPPHLL